MTDAAKAHRLRPAKDVTADWLGVPDDHPVQRAVRVVILLPHNGRDKPPALPTDARPSGHEEKIRNERASKPPET
jgi:hypothetical protein